jgi:TRAP-type C4-dicarboxylate transport system permease small subunit
MQRWILNLIAAALLAVSALLAHYGAGNGLGTNREGSSTTGMPDWLSLLVSAGAYLLQWGPALFAALIFFCANRRRG